MRSILVLLALAAPAYADTPRERALALVSAQLADGAQLSPDTVIVGNGALALAGSADSLLRPSMQVLATQVTRVEAGATADALWLSADIVRVHTLHPRVASTTRLTELVVRDGDAWKVAVIDFTTEPRAEVTGDKLGAPKQGPLVSLLASPSRLDDALRDDALGTIDDRVATGADEIRHAIADWHARDIRVGGAIEVRGKTGWSYALGSLAIDEARAMVLVVAVDGKIVALHSTSL